MTATIPAAATLVGSRRSLQFAAPDITDDDVEAVTRALKSGWITTAGEAMALEDELAAYLGVPHVITTSSCTAALDVAVAYLQLPPGARVAVPTWTFVSTALAAVHAGLQPVLVDVDADTLNLSPAALAAAIDEGVDAVVGVHFGGQALDRAVHDLCRDADVPLVEDAAHALGTRDHRGLVAGQGTGGACYSFYATKNLTCAEGGALATDDDELASFARSFRLHGLSHDAWARYHPEAPPGYDLLAPGIKGNLPDVLAALARSQLARFDQTQARRRQLVVQYRAELATVSDIRLVPGHLDSDSADHLMVVVLPDHLDRNAVVAELQTSGVPTSVHFQPLHTFGWFAEHAPIGPGGVPNAERVAAHALSLPLHAGLGADDVSYVVDQLRAIVER
jgi:dTDP-4-amino-4,6-dideoxygalactose transaminase